MTKETRTLVIAEHNNSDLNVATLRAITAAKELSSAITVFVVGHGCASVADHVAEIVGVSEVWLADHAVYQDGLPENLAELIVSQAQGFTHILAASTTFGKNLMPRVAALLDVAQLSDVIKIHSPDTVTRPIYAGNVLITQRSLNALKVLTIRPTAFEAAEKGIRPFSKLAAAREVRGGSEGRTGTYMAVFEDSSTEPTKKLPAAVEFGQRSIERAPIHQISTVIENTCSQRVSITRLDAERPDLGEARVVISGGRGLQSAENFQLLEEIAKHLNAALGASRAAVDAGFVPNEWQVGQTGRVVAPELYIAVGISGAVQHLAGMKDSKVIVAINKDPDAPIFEIADYGLVGDLFTILPQLALAISGEGE